MKYRLNGLEYLFVTENNERINLVVSFMNLVQINVPSPAQDDGKWREACEWLVENNICEWRDIGEDQPELFLCIGTGKDKGQFAINEADELQMLNEDEWVEL